MLAVQGRVWLWALSSRQDTAQHTTRHRTASGCAEPLECRGLWARRGTGIRLKGKPSCDDSLRVGKMNRSRRDETHQQDDADADQDGCVDQKTERAVLVIVTVIVTVIVQEEEQLVQSGHNEDDRQHTSRSPEQKSPPIPASCVGGRRPVVKDSLQHGWFPVYALSAVEQGYQSAHVRSTDLSAPHPIASPQRRQRGSGRSCATAPEGDRRRRRQGV